MPAFDMNLVFYHQVLVFNINQLSLYLVNFITFDGPLKLVFFSNSRGPLGTFSGSKSHYRTCGTNFLS